MFIRIIKELSENKIAKSNEVCQTLWVNDEYESINAAQKELRIVSDNKF